MRQQAVTGARTAARTGARTGARLLGLALVIASSLGASVPVSAHELSLNTATATLRSGHLEVRVQVDLLAWFGRVDGGSTPIDIARLLETDPLRLEQLRLACRELLARELQLRIDGEAVTVSALRFPSESVVRSLAARALVAFAQSEQPLSSLDSSDEEGAQDDTSRAHLLAAHGEFLPVLAEVRIRNRPKELGVRFPASLGPMQVQLVEPQYRTVPEGQAAVFAPLVPAAPP